MGTAQQDKHEPSHGKMERVFFGTPDVNFFEVTNDLYSYFLLQEAFYQLVEVRPRVIKHKLKVRPQVSYNSQEKKVLFLYDKSQERQNFRNLMQYCGQLHGVQKTCIYNL